MKDLNSSLYAIFRRGCDHCDGNDWEQLSVWLSKGQASSYKELAASSYKTSKLYIFSREE